MEAAIASGVFGLALVGIFLTKTPGFGRYTSSTLLLTLVLYVATVSFFLGKIEGVSFLNILFAVAGWAGGLITGRGATGGNAVQ